MTRSSLAAAAVLAACAVSGCGGRAPAPEPGVVQSLRATARLAQGRAAEARGDTKAAEAKYIKALRRDPDHTPSLKRLAEIYTARGNYDQALHYWKRHLEAAGRTADAYNDLAYCFDLAGWADPAEAAYLRGVEEDPTNTRCRTNYGLFLARHGRPNEAILHLRNGMPPADAHYNLATVLEDTGDRRAARAEYQKALNLDPALDDARTRLAAIE